MKRIRLLLISFLLLSTHSVNAADGEEKYVAAKSGINLRSDPSKSGKVITLIPFGTKVTIEKSEGNEIFLDERYGKWVNVKYGNKTGWVFSGFLCDFKPDTVIKPVGDFYRDKYKGQSFASYMHVESFTHFKDSSISIVKIIDNYILLGVPIPHFEEKYISNVVWRYDIKQKKFFEAYNCELTNTIEMFYLDNDKYPDLVVDTSCCTNTIIDFYLGSEKGFVKVSDFRGTCSDGYSYYTVGSCGDTEFACNEIIYDSKTDQTDAGSMSYYRFNCDKRKFEKYADGKITELYGNITSIDLKNMSIVIKDEKDSKDTSYKFNDKTNVFYNRSEKDIKAKDLKKGDSVSFAYVIIDGKKIVISIRVYD